MERPVQVAASLLVGMVLTGVGWADNEPISTQSGPISLEDPTGLALGVVSNVLQDVPAYDWYHGCGPTAAASVIGYYDLHGFPNLYDASGWEQVKMTDNVKDHISSPAHNAKYDPTPDDPTLPVPPNTSIACWYRTSVDPLQYGWSYLSRSDDAFEGYLTYRGYECDSWYESYASGQFTWNDLVTEINASRPVMFLVDTNGDGATDHFVPVFGYDDRGATGKYYGCYTTWSESESIAWKEFRGMGNPWGVGYCTFARITSQPATDWAHDPGTPGDWSTATNWTSGEPTSAYDACIDNGGTAQITQEGEACASLSIGETTAGTRLEVTSGSLSVKWKLNIAAHGTLKLDGGTVAATDMTVSGTFHFRAGTLELSGGNLLAAGGVTIPTQGLLRGLGIVQAPIEGLAGSAIVADGSLTLGDANRYDGFNHAGTLDVGSHAVTLHAKGSAKLGILTTIAGGSLSAPNGLVVGCGNNLVGSGTVDGRLAGQFGSTIEATGDLALGDSSAYDGFLSDGSLLTGSNTVTINDRNEAVLGSLTELGDGANGGTLTAGNAEPADTYAHFLLEQGKNMVGRGQVNGNYKNHGHVIGDGTAGGERIVFSDPWIVSGKGTFTNTLILGTFATGESPGVTTGQNQGFGGTVEIELGGTAPGFGDDNHDQINDTGTILLSGSPTLEILPWNSFLPEFADEFVIMTWQEGLDGTFGVVITDPWFTDHEIWFELHYNNVGGAGDLTIEAVPEPATVSLLAFAGFALVRRRRRGPNA